MLSILLLLASLKITCPTFIKSDISDILQNVKYVYFINNKLLRD